jgi:hypothetical protein
VGYSVRVCLTGWLASSREQKNIPLGAFVWNKNLHKNIKIILNAIVKFPFFALNFCPLFECAA